MEKEWGEIAYEAYRRESGGVSLVSGDPIPEWDELPAAIRYAWNEAAQAVRYACADVLTDRGDVTPIVMGD